MKKYASAFIMTFIFLTANAQETMTEKDKLTYAHGIMMAKELKSQDLKDINTEIIIQAMNDFKNNKLAISEQEAEKILMEHNAKIQSKLTEMNKEIGEAFLAENAKKEGIITTASGLQYEVLKSVESGASPTLSSEVNTHYHGTLIDGTVFDSSVERGQPASFPLNMVIPGWTEALQLMPTGSKWRLYLPPHLAYGDRQAGAHIKANSTLIFEVELLPF